MEDSATGIVARFGGRSVGRTAVEEWEDRRIDGAAKKLGVAPPPTGEISVRRERWLEIKRELGGEEIRRRTRRDTKIADAISTVQSRVSSRRRASIVDLYVPNASAQEFTEKFNEMTFSSDSDAMERACPDHFVLRFADGRQEVLETNGGSPFAARFWIDYEDLSSLRTPIDPAFSHRLDGVARSENGTAIGGVRHQFRDTSDGVHARLLVEFPLLIPPMIVTGHRWHLACEFSNWFESL